MIEWLAAALIITGVWVWIWAAVCFVLVLAFAENEKNFFAFLTVAIFMGIMYHSGIVVTLFNDPVALIGYFAAYFVVGGVWSFVKWFSFINKKADDFGELKLEFIKRCNKRGKNEIAEDEKLEVDTKTKLPTHYIPTFNKFLRERYFIVGWQHDYDEDTLDSVIPSAQNHKEKIVTWILWWPTSAFWTILNDPLVKLANWMYDRFQGLYKKIANRAFAKFEI